MSKIQQLENKMAEAILPQAMKIAHNSRSIEEFIYIIQKEIEERKQALEIATALLESRPTITDAPIDVFNELHGKYKQYYLFAIGSVKLWINRRMLTKANDWHQHIYDDLECSPEIELEKITDLFYYRNWHFYIEPETGVFKALIDRSFYEASSIEEMEKIIDQGIEYQ